MNWSSIKNQMITFLQNEVLKVGFSKVTVGISGGLDSAVVAILCKEAFGDNVGGVFMPSQFSSKESIDDAKELCEKFGIRYEIVSIANMIDAYFENKYDISPLRIGNFSARMRMSVLYDISARDKSLVVGTSNKSEILLGYGTIFGDTACALNPIGEMYKSDEFAFAKYLGVPDSILNKKPSADLWAGQSDEDEIGYSYEVIDNMLKKMIDDGVPKKDLIKLNEDKELIEMLEKRIKTNAFKGKLPTIAKINFK